ncbi:MAG: serine/threonine protein kinase [Methylacidiphilales bacterium]|nr:serine/threonine protein kinase [Candidatus Methylacidiphilales bacterium]
MPPKKSSGSAWGDKETRFFYGLTPDQILDAVETFGFRCTGRCLPLNSMENRVYDVGIEIAQNSGPEDAALSAKVAKFYRPGRWTQEQILDEHRFLFDLEADELSVVPPHRDGKGESLHRMEEAGIWYAVFPRIGGRNPDELSDVQLERIGRLLARLHNTGEKSTKNSRLALDIETYGWKNLDYLESSGALPEDISPDYHEAVEQICEEAEPLFQEVRIQRIHGDCHLGNLLWRIDTPYLVDFDDMVTGPCVQDIWLLTPGRDAESLRQREILLGGYEAMRSFDPYELALVEPLRALRYVHFSAWVAKRWKDPAFPKAFPHFTDRNYWRDQLLDLRECLEWMER